MSSSYYYSKLSAIILCVAGSGAPGENLLFYPLFIIPLRNHCWFYSNYSFKAFHFERVNISYKLQIFHKLSICPYAFSSTNKKTLLYLDAHLIEPAKTTTLLVDNRCAVISLNNCFTDYILREIFEAHSKVAI